MPKPKLMRPEPPFTEKVRNEVTSMQAHVKSGHETYFMPRARPDNIDEIWNRYVGEYTGWEIAYYLDLHPSPTELDLWLKSLRQRTISFFAAECPDRDVSVEVDQQINGARERVLETLRQKRIADRAKRERYQNGKKKLFAINVVFLRLESGFSQDELANLVLAEGEQAADNRAGSQKPRTKDIATMKRNIAAYEAGKSFPGPDIARKLAVIFTQHARVGHVGVHDLIAKDFSKFS